MRRITIRITGLSGNLGEDDGNEEPYWRPLIMWMLVNRPIGHCAEGVYVQFCIIYKAKLLFAGSPARKVYYTTYKFQTAIALS